MLSGDFGVDTHIGLQIADFLESFPATLINFADEVASSARVTLIFYFL